MKQFNDILKNDDKLLGLVISNKDCTVNRDYVPLVNDHLYRSSLFIEFCRLDST